MPRLELPDPPLQDGVVALRAHREADVPAIVRACQDPEIARWTTVPSPYGEADAQRWVAGRRAAREQGDSLDLLVVGAGGDELLGSLGLVAVRSDDGVAEIGYWLSRPARGRGLAARALELLSAWALGPPLDLPALEVLVDPRNGPSRRLAERCRFTASGDRRLVPATADGLLQETDVYRRDS